MDNHNVLCILIIFLQIALPRGSTYNFSLCNHGKIQEDLLNVLDPDTIFTQEELRLDFHTCEDAPSEPAGKQQSEDSRRAERAGRLLECFLQRARGCGEERPELWRVTWTVLKHHCPGFCAPRKGAGTARRDSPAHGSAGTASPAPCDRSKARELMAVWRSYSNLG